MTRSRNAACSRDDVQRGPEPTARGPARRRRATGLLTIRAGAPAEAWVFVAHALVGGVLFAAVVAKVWRSVPRAIRAGARRASPWAAS